MRGAHWDNYARELIGLVVAQREIELLLSDGEDHRTVYRTRFLGHKFGLRGLA